MVLNPRAPPARREVDAILEADETQSRSRTHSTAKFLSEEPPVPAAPVPATPSSVGRSRSHTESSTSRPSVSGKAPSGPGLLRKASFNGASRSSPDTTPPNEPSRSRKISEAPKLAAMPDMPVRKRGVARRRESMDLDDILNDVEPVAPRRGGAALTAKPAHQTANTRDLIDFLSEGPPEPSPHVARLASSGAIEPSPTVKPKQSGRWFRRLVGGSTSERAAVPVPDVPEPTPARVIGKQKSATNMRGNSASGFSFNGKIPPSPALSLDTSLQPQPSVTLSRKVSPNRKAVPSWDAGVRSPEGGSAPSTALLSPQRDVFTSPRPAARQSQDPLPTLSPASSKPSSLKRVPVPKLDDDLPSHAEVSEHGLQLVPEPKTPKTERRRPEKIQEPIPEDKSQPTRASLIGPAQAAELRSAIAHATSADECRMLLDMVLGQWGMGRHDPEPSAVPPLSAGCSDFDDSDEAMAVDMLLGEGSMRTERQWPLTPKDSHPRLNEARVASSLRSSE